MSLLALLDYAAVLVFAITGALVASRAQLDIVGFAFIACLTAVGGGTIRDLLLDRNPIFWIETPSMLGVAIVAALVVSARALAEQAQRRPAHGLSSRHRTSPPGDPRYNPQQK